MIWYDLQMFRRQQIKINTVKLAPDGIGEVFDSRASNIGQSETGSQGGQTSMSW